MSNNSRGKEYFCYDCRRTISLLGETPICPICGKGFIEEVNQNHHHNPLFFFPSSFAFDSGSNSISEEITSDSEEIIVDDHQNDEPERIIDEYLERSSDYQDDDTEEEGSIDSDMEAEREADLYYDLMDPHYQLDDLVEEEMLNNPQQLYDTLRRLFRHYSSPALSPQLFANPGDYVFGERNFDAVISVLMDEETEKNPHPPAPPEVISALAQYPAPESLLDEKFECPICLDAVREREVMTNLHCEHNFHYSCLIRWLNMNGTCPVCRLSVVPSSEES